MPVSADQRQWLGAVQTRGVSRRHILNLCGGALGALASPVPASAALPARLTVEEVASGIFVARGVHDVMNANNGGHIANLTYIVGRERTAVIDTGGSAKAGAALLAAIRETTKLPLVVINTHMHPDHVLGNAAFEESGVEFLAHWKMARGLSARGQRYIEHNGKAIGSDFAGTRIVLPTRPIELPTEVDLGGRTLRLLPQKTAHTDNDLAIFDSQSGVLIAGDLVFCEHIPTIDGSLRGWLQVLTGLEGLSAARVVPGHGPASVAWNDGVGPLRRYLEAVARDVRGLIKNGKSLREAVDVAARDEFAAWQLSAEYHQRNIAAAFAELEWE